MQETQYKIRWINTHLGTYDSGTFWRSKDEAAAFVADLMLSGHSHDSTERAEIIEAIITQGEIVQSVANQRIVARAAELAFYAQYETPAVTVEQEDDGEIENAGVLTTFGAYHDQDTAFIA